MIRELSVGDADTGERLDRFLAKHLPDKSRSALARAIDDGRVTVRDAVVTKAGHRLKAGDRVAIALPPEPAASTTEAEDIPLVIVHRDEHLAVIDKPSGLVVHPAPGHASGTLVNALLHWAAEEDVALDIDDEVRPGLVHRIDKDTSGLLVVAFDDATLRGLQAQFAAHTIDRRYRAVVLGTALGDEGDEGTIRTPFGRDPRDRKKLTGRLADAKRHAVTRWRVVRRGVALSLVELSLETGRTHQIRVHLSEAGAPVVADPIYGREPPRSVHGGDAAAARRELKAARMMPRLALHAARLGFAHPMSGERLTFESPDPEDLAALLGAIG